MQNRRDPLFLTFAARQSNWLERVLYAIGGIAVVMIGFFFLTVALVVGALLALVIVARLWWLSRKLQRARNRNVVEGEYEVVERPEHDRRR
jgi:hypothetical protein